MTDSSERLPWETDDDAPLGPATPEEPAAAADLDLDVPLAPFFGPDDAVDASDPDPQHAIGPVDAPWLETVDAAMADHSTETAPAQPTEIAGFPDLDQFLSEPEDGDAGDLPDLPPLGGDDPLPGFGPDLAEAEPWESAPASDAPQLVREPAADGDEDPWAAEPEKPSISGVDAQASVEPSGATEPWETPVLEDGALAEQDMGDVVDPGWAAGAALEADREVAGESTIDTGAAADALSGAAERLERIAAALRSGNLDALVAKGDPLEALVIGYVLGARSGK